MTTPTRLPRGGNYDQLGVRIDAELIAWIRAYAERQGITVNSAVAEAIDALKQVTETR